MGVNKADNQDRSVMKEFNILIINTNRIIIIKGAIIELL